MVGGRVGGLAQEGKRRLVLSSMAHKEQAVPPQTELSRSVDASVFEVATPLIRDWKFLTGLPLTVGVIAAAISLLLPARYTATASFVPEAGPSGGSAANLASVIGQFGINIGADARLTPDFFAAVLRSRELLRATLLSQFEDQHDSRRTLLDILQVEGETEDERINRGIRRFAQAVSSGVNRRTGIVQLNVSGSSPSLVAHVANRMLDLLNDFNLDRRQLQSSERRRFVGERLAQAQGELREAEEQHLKFLQANHAFEQSPLLRFEENRLAHQVQLRQEIFVTLSREYEEARIAEVRDTPVLTIIDRAVPPDLRSFPKRKLIVFLATIAALVTAIALIHVRHYHDVVKRQQHPAYATFVEAVRTFRSEFRLAGRSASGRS